MAVGDQDHGSIAVPVPVLPCGCDQALGFFGGPVCAGAALGLGNGPGRDCPINLHDYTRVAQAEGRLVLRANGRPDPTIV